MFQARTPDFEKVNDFISLAINQGHSKKIAVIPVNAQQYIIVVDGVHRMLASVGIETVIFFFSKIFPIFQFLGSE